MIKNFKVKVNGKSYDVEVEELNNEIIENKTQQNIDIKPQEKNLEKTIAKKEVTEPKKEEKIVEKSSGEEILAPLPGVILDILVNEGQQINKGDKLLVIEAMKMENDIQSEYSGIIDKILVKKGDSVDGDQPVIILK
ncbi:MAG: glutaconyl-CoA/methylmalonyl-CoA decarboxylase subunit gamma [Oceanotoga sp.]|jgi:biotin carboxyl carrier protein|uniref:Biotin-dependent enzyme n=1 Tax=Oceanotoga teriensis TaxID=515440 RepID=A0AA45C8Z2_9BACT|nr:MULTISPECIES: biotin/lipoyl-containing protein [Oceanotoga]MDN5341605.1 glutaconyl-CoA/methylmalonyl-CoA decarboxylase subunit gamma [Oceanotoga sp.]PWJ96537.1 biotin-dependent enzyme [Oceanotoga teriensis]